MIAHLGMYDRPETAAANDRLWTAVRKALGYGPEHLTRSTDVWDIWRAGDLLLSQTCGMPYRARLHGKVSLVASPDHRLGGCPKGHYQSVIVALREMQGTPLEGFAGKCLAFNEPLSQSGWAAIKTHMDARGITPRSYLQTGAHIASAHAVATGRADFASLDVMTWQMIRRYDSFARDLTEITRTAPTPALPFITAFGRDPEPLRAALGEGIATLSDADQDTLGVYGVTYLPPVAYLSVPTPPPPPV